jgi:hypothetical protein
MGKAYDSRSSPISIISVEKFVVVEPKKDAIDVENAATISVPRSSRNGTDVSLMLVDFDGPNDTFDPMNWCKPRKLAAVLSLCSLAFSSSFASSVFAPATTSVADHFHVSQTVANLGVSLHVLGFAAGQSSEASY